MNLDEARIGDVLYYPSSEKFIYIFVIDALNCEDGSVRVIAYNASGKCWLPNTVRIAGKLVPDEITHLGNLLDNQWVKIEDWADFLSERKAVGCRPLVSWT